MEKTLAAIWQEVLGIERVGIHDDFFQLGGHSLNVLQLAARVEGVCGRTVPIASLFQASTVATLTELISSGVSPLPATLSMVTVRPGGTMQPLVFMPNLGGAAFCGRELVQGLPAELPLYSVQIDRPPDWTGHNSLEAIAAECVTAIENAHLPPPHQVAGYSFGGMLAYEVARQLAAKGRRVAFVGILDTGPDDGPRATLRTRALFAVHFARNLIPWLLHNCCTRDGFQELRAKSELRLKTYCRRLHRMMATGSLQKPPPDPSDIWDEQTIPPQQRGVWQAHLRAFLAYDPAPYDGSVVLFRAAVSPAVSLARTRTRLVAGGPRRR